MLPFTTLNDVTPPPTHTHTHTLTKILQEESARCIDLYLTTHNAHNRQISMPPEEIRTRNPRSQRPQTHPLQCVATGIGEDTCNFN